MSGQVWFDGGFIRAELLPAAPFERAWRYGDGGFETMLLQGKKIPLLQHHIHRAYRHAEASHARLELPSADELDFIFEELAAKNGIKNFGRARLTWFRKPGGLYFPETNETSVLMELAPFDPQEVKRKLYTLFYTDQPISAGRFSEFKKISAQGYVQAAIYARHMGADDALLCNAKGHWTELTSSNLLIRTEYTLLAPPTEDGAVEGILLNRLPEWLAKWGFDFKRRSITTDDLSEADDIFSINALRGFCRVQLENFPLAETSMLEDLNLLLDDELKRLK